jgi:nucleotide-binding universal stress UspA family protein
MFERLLVAIESLATGSRALYVARRLAQRSGACLFVLHVAPLGTSATATPEEDELRRQVRALRTQGLDAHFVAAYSSPEEGIAEVAECQDVDLIVMAPHARTGWDSWRHPSVTQRVLGRTSIPVLTWPQQLDAQFDETFLQTPGAVVIAPLDGSNLAEEALPFAVEVAADYGRTLLLVRVLPTISLHGASPQARGLAREARARQEREIREYLASVRARLIGSVQVRVEYMLTQGSPAARIVDVAEVHPGSVIVMRTHGRGNLARMVTGSVATDVVKRTPAPVLIVPSDRTRVVFDLMPIHVGEPMGSRAGGIASTCSPDIESQVNN